MDKYYRITINFLEPERLSDGFKSQFRKELSSDGVHLGIRFNPTTMKRSAAINSLELAYQCIEYAKLALEDYGKVICSVQAYPCNTDFMKSIIDTDSRMLIGHMQSAGFAYDSLHLVANDKTTEAEAETTIELSH